MKNKNLALLVIGLLLIITIIWFAYRLVGNEQQPSNSNDNETSEKTLLQIMKEDAGDVVKIDEEKKVEYNKMMIDSGAFKFFVKIGKVATTSLDGNEFTDAQMLSFASGYAFDSEREILEKNSIVFSFERPSYVKFEYLNGIAKKYFGRDIAQENLSNIIKDGYIEIGLPTSVPETLYKFKEIKYNKENEVYSIYFDEIDPENANFKEIKNKEKFEYNSDAVLASYRILYKKVADGYRVLGIQQIV